jgi:putative MATE family efflux protein
MAMGQESIWKLLFKFSGPSIISMMVASSYNVVDAIFVGRIGPGALAALTIVFPLMMIFMAIGVGTGTGAASLISRRLGTGDHAGASHTAAVAISLSVILGGLFTGIVLPNLEPLLRLFGASEAILPQAESYMSILATFTVVAFFPIAVGAIVRAEGNPILASAVMVVSALSNIALDPFLIFGLGPFPEMGVAGAATTTVAARGIGSAILIGYLASKRTAFRFRPGHFLPSPRIVAEIYRVGVASIVRSASGSAIMVLVNRTAASFGLVPLAVLGVLFRSFSFAIMPSIGIGQGMLPLVGYNYGAKQMDRVGEVVIKAALASFAWGALCWTTVMLFPGQVISIFSTDPEFLAMGTDAVRIFAMALFLLGVQMATAFFFQGIGRGLPSVVLTSARDILFVLPLIFILPRVFGLPGLWAVFPAADTLSAALTITWAALEFRRLGIRPRLRYRAAPPEAAA